MATTRRQPTAEEVAVLKQRLQGMSREEKEALAQRVRPIIGQKPTQTSVEASRAPQTDDELHAAIVRETGFNIPRVAVCEDHCAPFDLIADGYFHRVEGIINLKSREAGGTLNASILQYMLCKYVPGHEGVQFGAIKDQAEKAFKYVKQFTEERVRKPDGNWSKQIKPEIDGEPLQKRIAWLCGSLLQIIVGTVAGVNSPHPNTVHADEVDLMDQAVIDQSSNMSSSSLDPDGNRIPALDLIVSTRKSMHGPMQKLIDDVDEAKRNGYESSYEIYAFCIYEIAQEVPECRCALKDAREARLAELGRETSDLCDCPRVIKGEWSENNLRSLETVCRGRFFRSRGWMDHDDVKRKFRKNSQAIWDAEMECRRPSADGLYLPSWLRQRFTVTGWQPRPELGNVWQGVDWGGSAPSAILYSQGPLRVPVTMRGADGKEVEVPRGSYVVFDEYYEAGIGATKLADKVLARELSWRRRYPGFRVTARFADMAGRQQRDDWREHNPPLTTSWFLSDRGSSSRSFEATVNTMRDLVGDGLYWVDSTCSKHMDDIESWRQEKGKEKHDDASHGAAATRYLHANVESRQRRSKTSKTVESVAPVVVQRSDPGTGVATSGRVDQFAGERWRDSFGGPAPVGSPFGTRR
jgi:hypothetical protein